MKKIIKNTLLCIVLFISLAPISYADTIGADNNKNIFTDEELIFLKNNPTIRVQGILGTPPYSFLENGEVVGFSIDHIQLLASKVGLEVEIVTGYSWNQFLNLLKQNEIDVMLNIVKNKSREEYFIFTSPYFSIVNTVFTKKGLQVNSLSDFNNKTLVVVKSFSEIVLLEKFYPNINIILTEHELQAFKLVSLGKADGTIHNIGVGTGLAANHGLTNIVPAFSIKDKNFQIDLHLATNKNNPILRDILEKGNNLITRDELNYLKKYWLVEERLFDRYKLYFQLITYLLIIALIITVLVFYRYFILKSANKKLKSQAKEIIATQAELKKLASTDSMTHLYNRHYLIEISETILSLEKRDKKEVSLLMIDLDKFKAVNDQYGHRIGDHTLILFSKIFKKNSRQSDVACRWGGEEFVLLLPNTSIDAALHVAEKIRAKVEQASLPLDDGRSLNFTVSIGVTLFDYNKDKNILDAINRADKALYNAKNSGRNKVCSIVL